VFVPGKPFQPSLMLVGKAMSLPQSGAAVRGFTWVGTVLTRKHKSRLESFPRTNSLSYHKNAYITASKSFITLGPG